MKFNTSERRPRKCACRMTKIWIQLLEYCPSSANSYDYLILSKFSIIHSNFIIISTQISATKKKK